MKVSIAGIIRICHKLSLVFLLLIATDHPNVIDSFSPYLHSHGNHFGHGQFPSTVHDNQMCTGLPNSGTQLNMAKSSNRARTEKNLEEMMGDDWRLFRARMVAQEEAEANHQRLIEQERNSNPNEVDSSNDYSDDKQLARQSHIAGLFAGAIASIFSSKDAQNGKLKNTSDGDLEYDFDEVEIEKEDIILEKEEIAIGSTGVPSFICEDPFATEAEIVATAQYVSAAKQLDKRRWAHPISHIEPGCVLVANEKLGGVFHQTVVLIIDHHEATGSTGIVINRPLPGNLLKIASETKSNVDLSLKLAFNCATVSYGGPVMQEDYSILHGYGEVEGAKKVAPGIFVGGSRELMDEVRRNVFDPHEALFVKGHAAWVPSQLSREIHKGVWYTASVSPEFILRYASAVKDDEKDGNKIDDLWFEILTCMGGRYEDIAMRYAGMGDRRVGP